MFFHVEHRHGQPRRNSFASQIGELVLIIQPQVRKAVRHILDVRQRLNVVVGRSHHAVAGHKRSRHGRSVRKPLPVRRPLFKQREALPRLVRVLFAALLHPQRHANALGIPYARRRLLGILSDVTLVTALKLVHQRIDRRKPQRVSLVRRKRGPNHNAAPRPAPYLVVNSHNAPPPTKKPPHKERLKSMLCNTAYSFML